MTAAGKTYEEIAQLVAEQVGAVGTVPVGTRCNVSQGPAGLLDMLLFKVASVFNICPARPTQRPAPPLI